MLDDIISARKAHFADGVQTVMRGHENRSRRVVLMKGNLVSNGRSESRGISARVTKNGRCGFASIASYTPEDAETVLKAATENAVFIDERAKAPRITYPALPYAEIPVNRPIVDTEQKRLIEAVKALDDYTKQKKEGKAPHFKAADIGLSDDKVDCWK